MPKALVLRGVVVDVVDSEFAVASGFTFVDADEGVCAGHTYSNGVFTAPPEPQAEDRAALREAALDALLEHTAKLATYPQAVKDYVAAKEGRGA